MKQQQTLQPKLRFPEFEGDWVLKKIKDIAPLQRGFDLPSTELIYGEYPVVYSNGIQNYHNSFKVDGPGIITGRSGTIGKIHYVEGKYWPHNTSLWVTDFKGNQPKFIYYFFLKLDFTKYNAGSTVPTLNRNDVHDLKKIIPSLPEQQKIADYLSTIDNKINLLEEKKAQLGLYKKAMMQKLFSQEIHFKPSEAEALEAYPEWEEKRLGEIGFFQTSSIDKLSRENEKEVFLINYMNVYRHEKIDKLSIVNYQKVTAKDAQIISCNIKKGDILFTPSSETPSDIGHSVVIFEDIENAVFSYHLMRFRPNIKLDLKYSHYFCNIPKVLNQLSKYATGSTRFTISVKSFANVIVDIPCYEEQQKIAEFLSAIDESIEKVNEQINQTQSFKKAMLQQMFV